MQNIKQLDKEHGVSPARIYRRKGSQLPECDGNGFGFHKAKNKAQTV